MRLTQLSGKDDELLRADDDRNRLKNVFLKIGHHIASDAMKKLIILIIFISGLQELFAQKTDKYITEKSVGRVIKMLAADGMMGRPAEQPALSEMATAFIEKEFKKIGLKPLSGLSGYRQQFVKQRFAAQVSTVTIDGEIIPPENYLIISEKTEINITGGLPIVFIPYDSSVQNTNQYFFASAFRQIQDTSSAIVFVAGEFQSNFSELRNIFEKRFTNGRTSTKVFVLGKSNASEYSVQAMRKFESIKMTNVVGQLVGKTVADEMVVFSAHYDHLGIQKPIIDGDSIANGADDDASGTTAVIELARYFKKIKKNNRTLVFVAFTAEELGGLGSQYFSQQLDPDKVVAMFNVEMIGKPSKWGINSAFITGYERSDFGQILQKNLAGTPYTFNPDPYPEQRLFFRSDNATLARLGVPAHTISTDQIDSDQFYHTVNDEVETLDMQNITATIRAIALSSSSIVRGTDTPKRIEKVSDN